MMSWTAYRLVYRACSPVHIGWHTLGYIKRTRPYIPGRAIWGAMVAHLARALGSGMDAYAEYGSLLKEKAIASYFFPAIDPNCPLLPEYGPEGLVYGNFSEAEFDAFFIRSFGQTAVLPNCLTAEDESLHESDFITPSVRLSGSNEACAVFFVGYLFIVEENNIPALQLKEIRQCLAEIFVGGDRKYGWGCLALKSVERVNDNRIFGHNWVTDSTTGMLDLDPLNPIPAHMNLGEAQVCGNIEPLVGLEWHPEKGAGHLPSTMTLCWTPGSMLKEKLKIPVPIKSFGILGPQGAT